MASQMSQARSDLVLDDVAALKLSRPVHGCRTSHRPDRTPDGHADTSHLAFSVSIRSGIEAAEHRAHSSSMTALVHEDEAEHFAVVSAFWPAERSAMPEVRKCSGSLSRIGHLKQRDEFGTSARRVHSSGAVCPLICTNARRMFCNASVMVDASGPRRSPRPPRDHRLR